MALVTVCTDTQLACLRRKSSRAWNAENVVRCKTHAHIAIAIAMPSCIVQFRVRVQQCGKARTNKCTTSQNAACNKHVVRTIALKHTPFNVVLCCALLHTVAETWRCNAEKIVLNLAFAQLLVRRLRFAQQSQVLPLSSSLCRIHCPLHSTLFCFLYYTTNTTLLIEPKPFCSGFSFLFHLHVSSKHWFRSQSFRLSYLVNWLLTGKLF